jgi:tyrosine-specific transport protein
MLGRYVGSVFILVGAAIGAGMLALPIVGAGAGFVVSAIALIGIWFVMTVTSLLTLEVNLAFAPYKNSFSTMAYKILGMPGRVVTWFAYLLLLYSTTAAYISGSTSLLEHLIMSCFGIAFPFWVNSVCFTLFFGFFIFFSVRSVDYMIRGLLSIKGIIIIVTLALLMPHIDYSNLVVELPQVKYVLPALPIFLNAFGFHFVIPSIAIYCNKNVKALRWIIIIATVVPLLLYLMWLFVSLGIIPIYGKYSFAGIAADKTSVGGFVSSISHLTQNKAISLFVNLFSNIAITTSFLGVGLGLFDFLADGFKRKNNKFGRFQTALLTFIPPLAFAILYPNGFIMALEYSALFAIVLEIFLPALMAYKMKKMNDLHSDYHCFFNKPIFTILLVVFGVALMVLVILGRLHLLPTIF